MSKKITILLTGVLLLFVLLNLTGFERSAEAADIPVHDPTETADDDYGSGTWGTCKWRITSDGVLTIGAGTGADIASASSVPWYSNRTNILQVKAESGVILPGKSSYLFYDFSNCTEMDLNGFDTSNVTSLFYMFRDCSNLPTLDLSNFNTEKVSDMRYIFYNCSELTSLNLSSFNTVKISYYVENYFYNCKKLKSVKISSDLFNSSKDPIYFLPYFSSWTLENDSSTTFTAQEIKDNGIQGWIVSNFDKDIEAISLWGTCPWWITEDGELHIGSGTGDTLNSSSDSPWSSFRTSVLKVTTDSEVILPITSKYLFSSFSKCTEMDLSGFNTSKVIYMPYMFSGCSNLTSINFENFNTANTRDMSYLFYNCSSLTTLNFDSFNTANVENMSYMFYGCSAMESLDLTPLNTSKVSNMSYMFYGCSDLTDLNVINLNTAKVTNMSYMFYGCSELIFLDLTGLSTGSLTNIDQMFRNCSKLEELDLSDINTTKVTSASYTFYNCPELKKVKISDNLFESVLPPTTFLPYYEKWYLESDPSVKYIAKELKDNNISGWIQADDSEDAITYTTISQWGTCSWWITSEGTLHIASGTGADISTNSYYGPWNSYKDSIVRVETEDTVVLPQSSKYLFSGFSNCLEFDLSGLDTSQATNMSYMFQGCSSLTSLDLSKFNTSQATNMSYLFGACSGLTSLDLSVFDTSQVVNITSMFSGCSGLTSLDLSMLDTTSVTSAANVFYGCNQLKKYCISEKTFSSNLDPHLLIPYFEIWSQEDDLSIKYDAQELKDNNIEGWLVTDGTEFTAYPQVWGTCPWWIGTDGVLHIGAGRGTNISEVRYGNTGGPPWFVYRESILKVKMEPGIVLPSVSACLFYEFSNCTEINFNNCDTSNVTNMNYMFYKCSSITSLDLSFFVTDKVTTVKSMFSNCTSLKSVDVSNFNTEEVLNMYYMFNLCSSLEELDLSSFNTPKLEHVWYMFYGCSSLTSLDVSNFDTTNITITNYNQGMQDWYAFCTKLKRIKIGSNYFNSPLAYSSYHSTYLPSACQWISEDEVYGPYTPSELRTAWQTTDEDGNYGGDKMAGWYIRYVPSYTLMFDANGGLGQMPSQKIAVGTTTTISPNGFYRFNHTFLAWNTESDGTGTKYVDQKSVYNIGSEGETITLYAQWAKNETKFNLEDGKFQIDLAANTEAVITGLPGGSTYAVSEKTSSGWIIQQSENTTGSINPNEDSVASFINLETDDSLTVTFSASKLLDGKAPDGQEFSFTLTEVTDSNNPVLLETVSNLGSSIVFSPVTFTHLLTNDDVETRTFEIREVVGSDSTINYDDHVYTVTVKTTVEDDKIVLYGYEEDGSSTFENTTKPGSLMISKTVEGTDATDKKFSFEVLLSSVSGEALDGIYGNVDVDDGKAEIALKANESVTLTDLPAGTVYRVTETDIPDGYICLDTDRTGIIKATEESTESFVNIYSAEGSVEIEAQKIYSGGSLTTGMFGFELYDTDGNLIASTTNNSNGTISFDEINYVTPGTYSYLVKEKVGSIENINYDLEEKPVTVTVTDNGDGTMSADIKEDTPTFTNSKQTGSLVFTKIVRNATEAAIDKAVFNFDITIEDADGEEIIDDFECTIGDTETTISSGDSFDLVIGETMSIPVLPDGAVVTITETTPGGFEFQDEESTLITTIKANEEAETEAVYEYASEVEVNITAQKLLIGASLADYQFDFGIYDEDGLLISNGTTDADGNITFEPLYYNSEDDGQTYRVSIIEKQGYSGIDYADSKEFTVTLKDNGDGTMTATTDWVGGNSVFINKIATGNLPSAGNLNRQHVVLSLMLVAFLFEAAYVLSKRKRK